METTSDTREGVLRDLAWLVTAAFAFRAGFWLAMPRVLDAPDAVYYLSQVAHFRAGDFIGYDLKIPVLYPLLGCLVSLAIPNTELACQLVSFAASTALIIPAYLLARALHGRSAARAAAIIIVVWTWLGDYASRVSTEAVACTLWFFAVWAFARGMRRGGFWPVAAAILFFGLHLARPEGTFLILAVFPAALILEGDRATRARRLAPFAAVCCVLLTLYGWHLWRVTGRFIINYRFSYVLNDVHVASASLAPRDQAIDFVRTASDTLFGVLPTMLGPVLMLFLGVGLFFPRGPRRDMRLECYVLFFAASQWAVSLAVRSPSPRYFMTVIVALSLWSARGAVLVANQAAAMPAGRWLKPLPMAAVVLPILFGTAVTLGAEHLGRRPREPREYKVAGLWMKEHLAPGLIFTRKPQIGYYAGNMPTTGPAADDTIPGAIERARNAGARYFVVDERYTAQLAPALKPLLEPAQAPPDLRLLYEFKPGYPEARVLVYEIGRATAGAP